MNDSRHSVPAGRSGEVFFDTWLMPAPGRVFLPGGHKTRILDSWDFFELPGRPDFALIQAEADRQAGQIPGPPWRVRVGFQRQEAGDCLWRVRVEPFAWADVCPERAWRAGWLETPAEPVGTLRRHKTVRNRVWPDALEHARRLGLDDMLIAFPGGRAAEFSRGNLFVLEGRRLVTPPSICRCCPASCATRCWDHPLSKAARKRSPGTGSSQPTRSCSPTRCASSCPSAESWQAGFITLSGSPRWCKRFRRSGARRWLLAAPRSRRLDVREIPVGQLTGPRSRGPRLSVEYTLNLRRYHHPRRRSQ